LSWFIDNYDTVAAWRATADRLTSFDDAMRAHATRQPGLVCEDANELSTDDLSLALPNGTALLTHAALHAQVGDAILLQGPSGSGKSTLLRAFAGIWPFGKGKLKIPASAMFLPQRPYFPDGPLRDALAYPEPVSTYSDEALRQALTGALLPQLADRLDDQDAWGQKLSGGEQQRLALARVLLKKPKWLFADEATSALDEPAEKILYEKLLAQIRETGGALVSIAHRPGVAAFHNHQWQLVATPESGVASHRLVSSGT
jgi:putative ATP-binding cassette transporter